MKKNKRERRKKTIEEIFQDKKYLNIFHLLINYGDLEFKFLRYALCKNHRIKKEKTLNECEKFFNTNTKEHIEMIDDLYKKNLLTKEYKKYRLKNLPHNYIDSLKQDGLYDEKLLFETESSLWNSLNYTMIDDHKLIKKVNKDFYSLTDYGRFRWLIHTLKNEIDFHFKFSYWKDVHTYKDINNDLLELSSILSKFKSKVTKRNSVLGMKKIQETGHKLTPYNYEHPSKI